MARVVGFEISSQDPEKAVQFYSTVLEWEMGEPNWGFWPVKNTDSAEIQGGISKGPHDYPHGTRIQIEVDSIEDTITKAVDNGALIVREKMEFDEFYLAYLVDPTGVGFGLVERK
ncbi:VOC family protein [Fredinandcohnia sp. QZ13]|uniref:VOC family protein n=1 Tax=Fredinandcohnia sp. QZ13 TaxID=3073144 RepID=UPI0028532039|nr:VOC family protein [Fredinandcohnia sp. QZ13]MDR4889704.1 VOC family protein [Fredinandcohnia sp. QZ13]